MAALPLQPSRKKSSLSPLALALASVFAAPPLLAQKALEEVIVTAQRRSENIQEVPIAVTRMTGDRMNARFTGGQDILALANAAPSLHVETSNGRLAPRFYMRGLGNADFTQAASQPVSIVMDDVVMEKASLKAFPLFDLNNIEILRGPQGTLFGRNTTAGIIKIESNRPTEETSGYITGAAGNLGTANLEGAIGGTLISDKLMGRLSFLSQNRDDWVDNSFRNENDAMGGFETAAFRGQLLWTPTEDLDVLFLAQHFDLDGNAGPIFRANVLSQGSNDLNENYDRDRVAQDGLGNNAAFMKIDGYTIKLDWNLGDHTLTSITSYQRVYDRGGRSDIDGGFGCLFTCEGPAGPPSDPFTPFASPFVVNVETGSTQDLDQFTQELRLASNYGGRLNYQVGFFYFYDDFEGSGFEQSAGATTFAETSRSRIENTAWAVFGQGTYDLSDALKLTVGLRYSDDQKEAVVSRVTGGVVEPFPAFDLEDDHLSWDVALSWFFDDSNQVYAKAASGFRAPTIQDRIVDDPDVSTADSETILSFEIGYKALWERTRLNTAIYYYEVDDMQLTAVGGADNSTRLLNADAGIGYGAELELEYLATDNLVFTGGFGYTKTEIDDLGLAVAPCGSGLCTVLDPLDAFGGALIDGNPFQHAPEWTANFEISYTYPLSSNSELYAFTDWKFKGETNDFLYESVEYVFDTQFEGGLRLGYRNTANRFEIGLFGRNITDEDNVIGGIDFANLLAYVNEPRVWGAEAKYRF